MAASLLKHLHLGDADLSYRKKLRLFFTVAAVVVFLGCLKAAVHYLGFEFLVLNALRTSGIGGAIFIIGFLYLVDFPGAKLHALRAERNQTHTEIASDYSGRLLELRNDRSGSPSAARC